MDLSKLIPTPPLQVSVQCVRKCQEAPTTVFVLHTITKWKVARFLCAIFTVERHLLGVPSFHTESLHHTAIY